MTTPRYGHTATLLPNGKVLIAGGGSRTTELYDPSTGTFNATGASTLRDNVGAATLLPDGRVLLIEAGAQYGAADEVTLTREAELYDPVTGITANNATYEFQYGYTAALLANGKVLVSGGFRAFNCCGVVADAELYDPSLGHFNYAGPYADAGAPPSTPGGTNAGLVFSAAALLPNGNVLVASGPASELYDATSSTFRLTSATTMGSVFLSGRAATLLANGNVLLTGGSPSDFDTTWGPLASAGLYDSIAGTFHSTGDMILARDLHAATLLPDGSVLITGGITPLGSAGTAAAELYNPVAGTFVTTGSMVVSRVVQQATLRPDGRVLITGGSNSGSALATAVAGEILSMYTTSLIDAGVIPPQVSIGGSPAEVLYFGPSGYPGYHQVNIRVPSSVAPGNSVPVRLTYIGRSSNAVTIGVR